MGRGQRGETAGLENTLGNSKFITQWIIETVIFKYSKEKQTKNNGKHQSIGLWNSVLLASVFHCSTTKTSQCMKRTQKFVPFKEKLTNGSCPWKDLMAGLLDKHVKIIIVAQGAKARCGVSHRNNV